MAVTDEEYKMAQEFVSSIPDTMPEGVSTLEELKAYQAEVEKYKAESKTLKGKIKHLFQRNKPEGINL